MQTLPPVRRHLHHTTLHLKPPLHHSLYGDTVLHQQDSKPTADSQSQGPKDGQCNETRRYCELSISVPATGGPGPHRPTLLGLDLHQLLTDVFLQDMDSIATAAPGDRTRDRVGSGPGHKTPSGMRCVMGDRPTSYAHGFSGSDGAIHGRHVSAVEALEMLLLLDVLWTVFRGHLDGSRSIADRELVKGEGYRT